VIKENIAQKGFIVHKDDCSVTRSDELYKKLFAKAGLQIIRQEWQEDFPKEMFAVSQYALRSVP